MAHILDYVEVDVESDPVCEIEAAIKLRFRLSLTLAVQMFKPLVPLYAAVQIYVSMIQIVLFA